MGKKGKKTELGKKEKARDSKYKLIFETPGEGESEAEDIYERADSGMLIGKDDVQLIYNALREYKPTEEEEHLHSVLLEQFEEILVVDYGQPYPDAN
jgi:hypothetical protein